MWNKHIGKKEGESICIVCREAKISMMDFHAAHIKSEANGGALDIDNLLPTCARCNSSMATQNMDEYIKKHYPKNYKKFVSRDYKTKNSLRNIFKM